MGLSPAGKSWSSLVKIKKDSDGQHFFKNLNTGVIEPVSSRAELVKHLDGLVDSLFPLPVPAPRSKSTAKKTASKSKAPAKRLKNGRFAPRRK